MPRRFLSAAKGRDICQARSLEERAEYETESEERYFSLTSDVLGSLMVGILILDVDFRVVWINQALQRYFGLHGEEVLGKDKRQLIRERIKYIFEETEVAFQPERARGIHQYEHRNYLECDRP